MACSVTVLELGSAALGQDAMVALSAARLAVGRDELLAQVRHLLPPVASTTAVGALPDIDAMVRAATAVDGAVTVLVGGVSERDALVAALVRALGRERVRVLGPDGEREVARDTAPDGPDGPGVDVVDGPDGVGRPGGGA